MFLKDMRITLPPPKILIGGLVGVGKTALATTYGKGMMVFALDNQLATCLTLKDKFYEDRISIEPVNLVEPNPIKEARTLSVLKTKLLEMVNGFQSKNPPKLSDGTPVTALCIDGLTQMVDAASRYVLFNTMKLGNDMIRSADTAMIFKNNLSLGEWGLIITEIERIVQLIRALPIVVIVPAHYESETTNTGGTRMVLAVPTKELPRKLPGYFDELWYLETRFAPGGGIERFIQTEASPIVTCRSSYNLPNNTNANLGMKEILKMMGVSNESK